MRLPIETKVVGVTYENRQGIIAQMCSGETIRLVREPVNSFDQNAISVERMDGNRIGYINRRLAAKLAEGIDRRGLPVQGVVKEIVGGFDAFSSLGVNIVFQPPPVEGGSLADEHSGPLVSTAGYQYSYPFDHFNPVQSQVFHLRENANNLIIAANTSAGKTIAAELVIDVTLARGQRVIYLSPLKALTDEKYADWQKRYADQTIEIMTGDYVLTPEKMKKLRASSIVVMTSEMMDSRTRKFEREKNDWMREVGLVVVDESHILTTSRGHAVETGIMRFTFHCPGARILFLSATMPNAHELGGWLTSLNEKPTDVVQSDWRPVALEKHFVEYQPIEKSNGDIDYWPTEYRKIAVAIGLIQSKPHEKFLVFVHSKNTGHILRRELRKKGLNARFHNADLNKKERKQIENSFRDRHNGVRILISTSTTAWGVNLPARNVVIVGVCRGLSDVDELDIIQMAGRAGRYGIDDEGHVYLIVPDDEKYNWSRIFSHPRPVTSVLNDHHKLSFHVLAEIYRGIIKTEHDVFSWYERSLAFRQGKEPFSGAEAEAVFQDLKQEKMIHEKNGRLHVTGLGYVSAVMYYAPEDIYAWYRNFEATFKNNLENSDEVVAWALGTIPIYESFVPKKYESLIGHWKSIFKNTGLFFETGKALSVEAVFNCLKKKKTEEFVRSKVRQIRNDAERITTALRMIDEKHARWHKKTFWYSLERRLATAGK